MQGKTFDADPQGAISFLTSQAAHIEQEVYRIEYPQYKYSRLVPLDSSAPDWTQTVVFRAVDARGKLKKFGPNSTDVPTVDVGFKQGLHNVDTFALGYTFSIEEINFASLNNINLDAERARAVRDVTEGDLNRIYLLGDEEVGEGLYTSGLVPVDTAAAQINTILDDPQAIISLFGGEYNKVYVDQTGTVHMPTTFVLPTSVYQLLNRTVMGTNNASNLTVLGFLRMNFPDMEFVDDILLENAGVGGTRRMITYKRDMRIVKGHDVMPLQFMAPGTADNVNFRVAALTRTGGTEFRVPKAASYLDGI